MTKEEIGFGAVALGMYILHKKKQRVQEEKYKRGDPIAPAQAAMLEAKQEVGEAKAEAKSNAHDAEVDNAVGRESMGTLSNGVEVIVYRRTANGVLKGAFVKDWSITKDGPTGPITTSFKYVLSGDPLYSEYKQLAAAELA